MPSTDFDQVGAVGLAMRRGNRAVKSLFEKTPDGLVLRENPAPDLLEDLEVCNAQWVQSRARQIVKQQSSPETAELQQLKRQAEPDKERVKQLQRMLSTRRRKAREEVQSAGGVVGAINTAATTLDASKTRGLLTLCLGSMALVREALEREGREAGGPGVDADAAAARLSAAASSQTAQGESATAA